MLICGKCGKENADSGKYCVHCGGAFPGEEIPPEVCPKCGAVVEENYMCCAKCNTPRRIICPSCHEYHHVSCNYCPYDGVNIAKFKEVKAEFEQVFPEKFRRICWKARITAFLVNLLKWEVIFLLFIGLIFMVVKFPGSLDFAEFPGLLGFALTFIIPFMGIVAVLTFIATGEAFGKKRQKLLEAYIKEKTSECF
jgi:hypothetical protein